MFSGGVSANRSDSENSWDQHHYVQQIRVKLDMKAPALWHHSRLGILFVETYKKEPRYQITVNLVGTDRFCLEGRVRFNKECKLRNARKRFKRVLMECQEDLVLSSAETKAFSDYLSRPDVLSVIPDDEPFSGEGPKRSWTVIEPTSQPPPPQQPPAAAAGAPGAHGGGTAPPTAACGSAAAASSTPPPPPPQARH